MSSYPANNVSGSDIQDDCSPRRQRDPLSRESEKHNPPATKLHRHDQHQQDDVEEARELTHDTSQVFAPKRNYSL